MYTYGLYNLRKQMYKKCNPQKKILKIKKQCYFKIYTTEKMYLKLLFKTVKSYIWTLVDNLIVYEYYICKLT